MRRRHTRKTDPALAGASIQRAVRVPEVQIEAIQAALAEHQPDLHSFADVVVDALWLWLYEHGKSLAGGGSSPGSVNEPPPPAPTEADQPYTGNHQRPSWSDVDTAAL